MRIIKGTSLSPAFNLAVEEALLESTAEDIFMLWRNAPSVIIGKNQNAWAEVNTDYTEREGIPVVRRLTGGGAVFHDPGNVNFTFITPYTGGDIDFGRFIAPITDALAAFGIAAERDGRNDIIADGYKISGNAQCVHRRRDGVQMLLHHGTLLFDADMTRLAAALRADREKLRSKGIASVSSRVKNIRDIGGISLDAEEFEDALLSFACQLFSGDVTYLTDEETSSAKRLADEKYSTWEWNFGRSPEHGEVRRMRFSWGTLEAGFTLDRGVIREIAFTGDFFGTGDVSLLSDALVGERFEAGCLRETLGTVDVESVLHGGCGDDVLRLLGMI